MEWLDAIVYRVKRTMPWAYTIMEGLGRGHLMDEVEVHVEEGWLSRLFMDHMGIPDFLEHGLGCHRAFLFMASRPGRSKVYLSPAAPWRCRYRQWRRIIPLMFSSRILGIL